LGILSLFASLYSLYLGVEFDRRASEAVSKRKHEFKPRVCLIMPCKGKEPGLERNIENVLTQEYGNYQTVIVTDSALDPAYVIARSILTRYPGRAAIYTSDREGKASGKVAALLTAVEKTKREAEVYAFVDSDSLVSPSWLGEVVDPLWDKSIGATTGFRWYIPSTGGFWSHVEAAWNASGTNQMFNPRYNFPWGGAMAIRAETLREIDIQNVWENAISDDMTLNSALRTHGYRIAFLPHCSAATYNKTNLDEFLRWAIRQIVLTRLFNRGLWYYAAAAYGFLNLALILGFAGLVLSAFKGPIWLIPSALLLMPTILGVPRSLQRCRTFEKALPHLKNDIEKTRIVGCIVSLIVPWIMTYCIIKSALTDEIEWRGRKYELTGMNLLATP
jgi:ceramide glucosyltransferase